MYFRSMKNWLVLLCMFGFMSSCERNNIHEVKDWSTIFKAHGIDSACFEIRDHNHEEMYYLNLSRAGEQRFMPASTFKVFLSLVGLETNVALDEKLVIPWNGEVYARAEWNKDMDMREALKVSSEPYYRELARRIGKPELQKWVDTVKFGNMNLGDSVDRCWVNNTLQITADEQVGLMKKLYFDKLPFSQRTQRIVKSLMLQEDSTRFKLYYKTGTGIYPGTDKKYIVWLVGFLEMKESQKNVETKLEETNFKPYFFAMNFDTNSDSIMAPSNRVAILKEILRERKILR